MEEEEKRAQNTKCTTPTTKLEKHTQHQRFKWEKKRKKGVQRANDVRDLIEKNRNYHFFSSLDCMRLYLS